MEYTTPETKHFGLVIAASYLQPNDGQVHPLQLIMQDRPVLHRAIANGGIFIDGRAALDTGTISSLYSIASGSAFDRRVHHTEVPYVKGETSADELARLTRELAESPVETYSGTPHVPLIFHKCLDGGFADILGEADQNVTNWNHVEVGLTVSPSARHIGITALNERFRNNPNVRFYMSGPMPEDDPSESKVFTRKSERNYTKHLARIVQDYGLAALACYGANAEDTQPFQELVAMGIVTDTNGSYASTYENNGAQVTVTKRSTTVEEALRGATFNQDGVCHTKLLIGHELARAEGHTDMIYKRKIHGDHSFDWGGSEGSELAGNYAKVLNEVVSRAMEADLAPRRLVTKIKRRVAGIPVTGPMRIVA